jgi:acyl dehydratase
LLKSECGYDAGRIRAVSVRFTAPVIPGETIRFQFWRAGGGRLQLRARVDSRDIVVLNNGVVELQ